MGDKKKKKRLAYKGQKRANKNVSFPTSLPDRNITVLLHPQQFYREKKKLTADSTLL